MQDINKELVESFRSLYDISIRMDEKIKNLIEKIDQQDKLINNLSSELKDLEIKLIILENSAFSKNDQKESKDEMTQIMARLQKIEYDEDKQINRWKTIVNFVVQLTLILVASYLLYKLGIQTPSVP